LTADPSEYLDASVTNLFYWNNAIHGKVLISFTVQSFSLQFFFLSLNMGLWCVCFCRLVLLVWLH
jgi:hypothetical protein